MFTIKKQEETEDFPDPKFKKVANPWEIIFDLLPLKESGGGLQKPACKPRKHARRPINPLDRQPT